MSTKEVHKYRTKLNLLFEQVNAIPVTEGLIRAHWSRYLCILVCGYLEVSVREILGAYGERCSNQNVANYVESQLRGFQNPNSEKILRLIGSFNPEWSESLSSFMEGEPKDAIDSIVNNRHQIAHGRDTGITFARIQQYYAQAEKVILEIDRLCGV